MNNALHLMLYIRDYLSKFDILIVFQDRDCQSPLMPESHERILRRIIRRFGSFQTRTYSNRISNDANVYITYEERSERVLNLNKTYAKLIRRVSIRRRMLADIRSCDRGMSICVS